MALEPILPVGVGSRNDLVPVQDAHGIGLCLAVAREAEDAFSRPRLGLVRREESRPIDRRYAG